LESHTRDVASPDKHARLVAIAVAPALQPPGTAMRGMMPPGTAGMMPPGSAMRSMMPPGTAGMMGPPGTGMAPPGTGMQAGMMGGSVLQQGLKVDDRPVTQQGMGGMKTAGQGPGRQIFDRSYFIGLLRAKQSELNQEIEKIHQKWDRCAYYPQSRASLAALLPPSCLGWFCNIWLGLFRWLQAANGPRVVLQAGAATADARGRG
jgi:hypothetical protein